MAQRRYPLVPEGGDDTVEAMTRKLLQGIVSDRRRHVIHVVRIVDDIVDFPEIDQITERMCASVLAKHGDQTPNVVVVQGDTKETLRLFGDSYAVALVRTAMFNAAVSWSPISLD